MEYKEGNPKSSVGTRKVPMSTLSAPVVAEIGAAMLEGDRKYGRHNYRVAGAMASVYYDATMRHLMAWWEGEDIDEDSGMSHITKAMSSLFVLRDCAIHGNLDDDRPPKAKAGWVAELNKVASNIIDKYPNAAEPYTEIKQNDKL